MIQCNIKCIFFAEFHPTLGPQISFQAPADFVTKEQMDRIAPYIIPKPQFQGRLISLKSFGCRFMGNPVGIENKKYDRNVLLFNVVFVFDEHASVQHFEPVVKKLAGYFTTLELESEYVSDANLRQNLQSILNKILNDLREKGECTIPVDQCNTIYLKVVKLPKEPPSVLNHQVPVFLWDKKAVESQHWDITAQHILPYIDGYNHVQKIACVSNVDLGLVRHAIETLLFYGVVALTPIFLYSNMYAVRPTINNILNDPDMQQECVRYVALNEDNLPVFRDAFKLYCALGPGTSVTTLCSRHDLASMQIDEHKLIQYSLVRGFVRKLNKIPVAVAASNDQQQPAAAVLHHQRSKECSKWFTGQHNYAEICCRAAAAGESVTYDELNSITESNPNVVHVWK